VIVFQRLLKIESTIEHINVTCQYNDISNLIFSFVYLNMLACGHQKVWIVYICFVRVNYRNIAVFSYHGGMEGINDGMKCVVSNLYWTAKDSRIEVLS
jgi:hypothetical protein